MKSICQGISPFLPCFPLSLPFPLSPSLYNSRITSMPHKSSISSGLIMTHYIFKRRNNLQHAPSVHRYHRLHYISYYSHPTSDAYDVFSTLLQRVYTNTNCIRMQSFEWLSASRGTVMGHSTVAFRIIPSYSCFFISEYRLDRNFSCCCSSSS